MYLHLQLTESVVVSTVAVDGRFGYDSSSLTRGGDLAGDIRLDYSTVLYAASSKQPQKSADHDGHLSYYPATQQRRHKR